MTGKAILARPRSRCFGDTVYRHEDVLSRIGHLLRASRPAAIAGLVVASIIFAVDAVRSRRLLTHVREKSFERTSPPLTHRNTPSAVVSERFVMGIRAALDHSVPRGVLRRVSSTVRQIRLDHHATAALRAAGHDVVTLHAFLLSAIASADQDSALVNEDRQSVKSVPREVVEHLLILAPRECLCFGI
jgi:hypothetical protein